jgi:hypothetical protein
MANPPSFPPAPGAVTPPRPLLAPPSIDLRTCREMQQRLVWLENQQPKLRGRNRFLAVSLLLGVVLLAAAGWTVYAATVGAYAVLDEVVIDRLPANQGRVEISFRVQRPGKVFYRRNSGNVAAELIDYFHAPGEIHRSWSWPYTPGEELNVKVWSRRSFWPVVQAESFPTARRGDIVILIDTTSSMTHYIAELRESCLDFSRRLAAQGLAVRFALLGFGDTHEGTWLDRYDFNSDANLLQQSVAKLKRFEGSDIPESALDAVEEGLQLPLDSRAAHRFYLITDAPYHSPTRSGADPAAIAARLEQQRVQLYVFCRREFAPDYAPLLGKTGRFLEIENFGRVLSEGRVLED